MKSLLRLDSVTKQFKLKWNKTLLAVNAFSCEIFSGETLGLVGESGSGKTTIGKMISGLETPTDGSIYFNNQVLPYHFTSRDHAKWAPHIQMIFQNPYSSLNPRMTVKEILSESIFWQSDLPFKGREEIIIQWLYRVGLSKKHLNKYPHEFSGGQRQRIGIARALILQPELLICDEPTSALDVSVQAQIINLLIELKSKNALTILFISHDLPLVHYIADRIAVMYHGDLVELGASDEVYHHPKHPYTQLLIASKNNTDLPLASNTIEDEVSQEANLSTYSSDLCPFLHRCPHAKPVCHDIKPTLKQDKDCKEHVIACHLYS